MFVLVSYDTQDAEGRSVRNIVRTGASGQYWSSSASWTRRSGRACAELSRGREKDSLRFHFLSANQHGRKASPTRRPLSSSANRKLTGIRAGSRGVSHRECYGCWEMLARVWTVQ